MEDELAAVAALPNGGIAPKLEEGAQLPAIAGAVVVAANSEPSATGPKCRKGKCKGKGKAALPKAAPKARGKRGAHQVPAADDGDSAAPAYPTERDLSTTEMPNINCCMSTLDGKNLELCRYYNCPFPKSFGHKFCSQWHGPHHGGLRRDYQKDHEKRRGSEVRRDRPERRPNRTPRNDDRKD